MGELCCWVDDILVEGKVGICLRASKTERIFGCGSGWVMFYLWGDCEVGRGGLLLLKYTFTVRWSDLADKNRFLHKTTI